MLVVMGRESTSVTLLAGFVASVASEGEPVAITGNSRGATIARMIQNMNDGVIEPAPYWPKRAVGGVELLPSAVLHAPNTQYAVFFCGWPFRCVRVVCSQPLSDDDQITLPVRLDGGLWLGPRPKTAAEIVPANVLPLGVLWVGFALNASIFGGSPFAALTLWWLVRRLRRRYRAQCLACGYPLGATSVCPECGAATAPEQATRAAS